jgi:hypothetical protein
MTSCRRCTACIPTRASRFRCGLLAGGPLVHRPPSPAFELPPPVFPFISRAPALRLSIYAQLSEAMYLTTAISDMQPTVAPLAPRAATAVAAGPGSPVGGASAGGWGAGFVVAPPPTFRPSTAMPGGGTPSRAPQTPARPGTAPTGTPTHARSPPGVLSPSKPVAVSADERVLSVLGDLRAALPAPLRREEGGPLAFTTVASTGQPSCMSTVLSQEIDRYVVDGTTGRMVRGELGVGFRVRWLEEDHGVGMRVHLSRRYNTLLAVVSEGVSELHRAINGLAVMSEAMDRMHAALLVNKVRGATGSLRACIERRHRPRIAHVRTRVRLPVRVYLCVGVCEWGPGRG